jgi:hypothetical protein
LALDIGTSHHGASMADGPDEFDLNAAWLRRSQGDLQAFVEAFAVRMEGALPGRVSVERKRDGLLSKTSHVAKVTIQGDKAVYQLTNDKGRIATVRSKLVRGVVISSATLTVPDWLGEVRAEVQTLAGQSVSASDVLHDFL